MAPRKKPEAATRPLLAVVADTHIGNFRAFAGPQTAGLNSRGELALATFRRAVLQARQEGAACFIIAGDVFHQRRPEPAVIAGVLRVLAEDAGDLPIVIVPGNHDMLDVTAEAGNTACEPLYREATVIREPEWIKPDGLGMSIFCVPFQSEMPMGDYLEKLLPQQDIKSSDPSPRVLVTHVGVWDDDAPTWCRNAPDGIRAADLLRLMRLGRFETAFVGNYHQHGEWSHDGCTVVQVGTLSPGGFGDAGMFPNVGGMALYDGIKPRMVEVPGPRFVEVHGEEKPPHNLGSSLFVRVRGAASTDAGRLGVLSGVEFIPDDALPQPVGLPQASDGAEAIAAFVAAMPLAEDSDRTALLTGALDYWQRSAT